MTFNLEGQYPEVDALLRDENEISRRNTISVSSLTPIEQTTGDILISLFPLTHSWRVNITSHMGTGPPHGVFRTNGLKPSGMSARLSGLHHALIRI